MKPIDIKQLVIDLPYGYETKITPFFVDNDPEKDITHKHITLPLLGSVLFIKDRDNNWFEGPCEICK